jgi:hypothetical protein
MPLSRMYQIVQIPRVGVDCDSYEVIGRTNFFIEKVNYEKLISINSLKEFIGLVSAEYQLEMMKLFGPHDTPYHLEDIDEHIDMCIKNSGYDKTLKVISMFHDLGKSVTKDGGKYIGHELVSSVYSMKALSEVEDIEDAEVISEVIFNHMSAHQGLSEKLLKRNNIDKRTQSFCESFVLVDNKSRITEENRQDDNKI